MPAVSILLGTALAALRITGTLTCPSEAQIHRHLDPLLAPGQGAESTLEIEATGQSLRLALLSPDGTPVTSRELEGERSCEEWASAVAIVVASWLSDLKPQLAVPEPLPATESLSTELAPSPARERATGWRFVSTLGATGSFGEGGFAPGVSLGLGLGPARARWAIELVGGYDSRRSLALDPGAVSWSDWTVGAGAFYAVLDGQVRLELDGSAVLGIFQLSGSQFTSDLAATVFNPGLNLAVRCLFLESALRPWVGLGVTGWLKDEAPLVTGTNASVSLPRATGWIGAGLAWRSP